MPTLLVSPKKGINFPWASKLPISGPQRKPHEGNLGGSYRNPARSAFTFMHGSKVFKAVNKIERHLSSHSLMRSW